MVGILAGRIALVTGASRGLGRATALTFAAAGAKVIALARTQGALEALDDEVRAIAGEPPTLVPLDLSETGGLDQLALEVFRRHGRLDILVHAAALLGRLWPAAHVPPEVFDKVLSTNLGSAFRLIRAFEPLLTASEGGRAVFVTCSQASEPEPFWSHYAAAKAAIAALAGCWAEEVDSTPLRVLLVDPGPMRTRLRAEAFPGEAPETVGDPADVARMILALAVAASDPGPPGRPLRYADWPDRRA